MPNTKPPKKYLVKQEWTHPSLPSKVRFVRGTSHALANYYGVGTMKPPTIRQVLSRAQKSYAHREACCYGRTSLSLVDSAPEGARISETGD